MSRKTTWLLGAGAVALAATISVPRLFAQAGGGGGAGVGDRGTVGEKEHGCSMVAFDRPFSEIKGRINDAATKAGLLVLANIDWTRFEGRDTGGMMPGGNRLDEKLVGARNVNTYLLSDKSFVNDVLEDPKCGLYVPSSVFFEKDGKTQLIYVKPSVMIEEMKKHGKIEDASKIEKHLGLAREYERKLDQFINVLKGTKSS